MTRFRTPRTAAVTILAALALALAAAGCAAPSPTAAPTTPAPTNAVSSGAPQALPAEVSVEEASAMRDAGAFLLDVREQEEWNEFHIPGATLIPLGELANRIGEVPADREVVVVCRSGNRSASGRDILLDAGHPSVTSMAGGMTDWAATGLPVETGP